jgi:hypothetical protein
VNVVLKGGQAAGPNFEHDASTHEP